MLLSLSGIFLFFRAYFFVSAFFVASYYTKETLMLASMYIAGCISFSYVYYSVRWKNFTLLCIYKICMVVLYLINLKSYFDCVSYTIVDAEVSMKMELLMQFGLLVFCIVWTFANIFMAYSFFFNTYLLSFVCKCCSSFSLYVCAWKTAIVSLWNFPPM